MSPLVVQAHHPRVSLAPSAKLARQNFDRAPLARYSRSAERISKRGLNRIAHDACATRRRRARAPRIVPKGARENKRNEPQPGSSESIESC